MKPRMFLGVKQVSSGNHNPPKHQNINPFLKVYSGTCPSQKLYEMCVYYFNTYHSEIVWDLLQRIVKDSPSSERSINPAPYTDNDG